MTDRVALYARVSTREQHPENQLLRLRAWAAEKGLEALEFEDAGHLWGQAAVAGPGRSPGRCETP